MRQAGLERMSAPTFFTHPTLLQNTEAAENLMRWNQDARLLIIITPSQKKIMYNNHNNSPLLHDCCEISEYFSFASPVPEGNLTLFFYSSLLLCTSARRPPGNHDDENKKNQKVMKRRRENINKNIKHGHLLFDCCVHLYTSLHHYGLFSLQIKPKIVQITRRLKSF